MPLAVAVLVVVGLARVFHYALLQRLSVVLVVVAAAFTQAPDQNAGTRQQQRPQQQRLDQRVLWVQQLGSVLLHLAHPFPHSHSRRCPLQDPVH